MRITRRNPFTNEIISRDIDCTTEQLNSWYYRDVPIQKAMPHLSASDREFIMTGITDEQWDKLYGVAEEEPPAWLEPDYEDWDTVDSGIDEPAF